MTSRRGSVAAARLSLYSAAWDDWARNNDYLYTDLNDFAHEQSPGTSGKQVVGRAARDANLKKWDGAARRKVDWDGLRKDPELWDPHGDCYVHLYGRGVSRRGPAFKVPMELLIKAQCYPLLNRFLDDECDQSPTSGMGDRFGGLSAPVRYDLYIPAPHTIERSHAMLYHIATRNFFAWLLGKSMVGSHLGGALVGLLDLMDEFRSPGVDNAEDILEYMDEEGYADMDSHPDHALAILYFAEHFEFENLWIDAYVHCVGMNERLMESTEFEHVERSTRSVIARARAEMNIRLNRAGRALSTFLEDDLLKVNQVLPESARVELDRFRSFLQAYYVAKLGYYPPTSATGIKDTKFPKQILEMIRYEFQSLYDYMVDENATSDSESRTFENGFSVANLVQLFDTQHRYPPLPHSLPLLPEMPTDSTPRPSAGRFPWPSKADKLRLDERLIVVSSLAKATNRQRVELMDCTLVRAFRGFEKQAVFSKIGNQKKRISQSDARKVRWILVYSILQTILSVTKVPDQVSNKCPTIPYYISVSTVGCPPWKHEGAIGKAKKQEVQKENVRPEAVPRRHSIATDNLSRMTQRKPDIPFRSSRIMSVAIPEVSERTGSGQGNVRRAISNLGKMPELRHPAPVRASCHEILGSNYSNGSSSTAATIQPPAEQSSATPSPTTSYSSTFSVPEKSHRRAVSDESSSSDNAEDLEHWSRSSDQSTRPSSVSSIPSTRNNVEANTKQNHLRDLFDRPLQPARQASKAPISDSHGMLDTSAVPAPLAIPARSPNRNSVVMITQEFSLHYDEVRSANAELENYLKS